MIIWVVALTPKKLRCVYFVSVAGLCVIGCLLCSFFWCKSCRCHYKKICPLRKGSQALLESSSSSSSSLDHLSTLSSSSASSSGSSQWEFFTFSRSFDLLCTMCESEKKQFQSHHNSKYLKKLKSVGKDWCTIIRSRHSTVSLITVCPRPNSLF